MSQTSLLNLPSIYAEKTLYNKLLGSWYCRDAKGDDASFEFIEAQSYLMEALRVPFSKWSRIRTLIGVRRTAEKDSPIDIIFKASLVDALNECKRSGISVVLSVYPSPNHPKYTETDRGEIISKLISFYTSLGFTQETVRRSGILEEDTVIMAIWN